MSSVPPPVPWPFPVWDGEQFSCPTPVPVAPPLKPAYPEGVEEAPF